uniref:VP2 n=1 Tax=Beihai conger calicivirus TaxID=2116161 RepID=A0A2P1GMH0_9CALI|nr:VP2 [Beihai conger calicivirus]
MAGMLAGIGAGAASGGVNGIFQLGSSLGTAAINQQTTLKSQQLDQRFRLGLIEQHKAALTAVGLPTHLAFGNGGRGRVPPNTYVLQGSGSHISSPYYDFTFASRKSQNGTNQSGYGKKSSTISFANPVYDPNPVINLGYKPGSSRV